MWTTFTGCQKSQAYIIEPSQPEFGNAVSLEMLSDFSVNFMKSLKAYSKSQYRDWSEERHPSDEEREIAERIISTPNKASNY